MTFKNYISRLYNRSLIQLLFNLRLDYIIVSSGLVLLGFFWNNLIGFDWKYIVLIFSVFFANLFGFVINDFFDSPYDFLEYNKKRRNIFCSKKTKLLGRLILYTSSVLSLLFSWIVSSNMFIIIIIFDFLAFFYSAPPIRLRNRIFWDWFFIFLWKGILIFAGYFFFSGIILPKNPFILISLMIVLLLSLINQIENQIRDFEIDKITNTNNSVQHLGFHRALSINRILLIIFYTLSVTFCYFASLYFTMILILLNILLYFFVKPSKYRHIIEFSNIWIIILFLENFIEYFNYQQQLILFFLILVMGVITIRHIKSIKLFN